jgi:CO/xanthine dehydrogenase Mo-binding subunit
VYEAGFVPHLPMEPLSCTARVANGECELWLGTQNPQAVARFVREAVKMPARVHIAASGGGFGRRLEVDHAIEAAQVAVAVATTAPVQLVWSREDDIRHDLPRPASRHRMTALLTPGAVEPLAAWRHLAAGPGHHGIAYRDGGELLRDGLAAPYRIEQQTTASAVVTLPLRTGPWRGVVSAVNALVNECFVDEVANALHIDPVRFRRDRLARGAMLDCLELAATTEGWTEGERRGRGVACHSYNGTTAAAIATVKVAGGSVVVERVLVALSCGTVVHPDFVAQQMEGGVAFAMQTLFHEALTFDRGAVVQQQLGDVSFVSMREAPQVVVVTVASTDPPTGVGEIGVAVAAPAMLNAIASATGRRLRRVPVGNDV